VRLRVADLFSGIGGFSLGLESTGGFETIAFCEALPERRRWLSLHWPGVPIHEDVRRLDGGTVGAVDVVAGGFPCQDISAANHRGKGLDGERSGLAFEAVRIIGDCRPRWLLLENSPRLRTRGADRLLGELEALGYTCWPLVVGARHVGAPHRRDRVWLIAHAHATRHPLGQGEPRDDGAQLPAVERGAGVRASSAAPSAHAHGAALREQPRRGGGPHGRLAAVAFDDIDPHREGEPQQPENGQVGGCPGVASPDGEPWGNWNGGPRSHLRMADGLSVRVARRQIAAFGDSVVPAVVAAIGRSILAVEAA
jgi:DNA (cytosine-5)-methyltransferase 1